MTKNEKRLNKAIEACVEAGDWDVLYTTIANVVIADARSGIAESKRDRKTLIRFVDIYGTGEQRVEMDHVFK